MFDFLIELWFSYFAFLPAWLIAAIVLMFTALLVLAIWRVIQ